MWRIFPDQKLITSSSNFWSENILCTWLSKINWKMYSHVLPPSSSSSSSSSYYYYYYGRLCGLVVRVPGYRTEMYCVSSEVRPEFICHVEESRPPLWSSGQSSWLQIQWSGFDSRHYQIFWEVVDLEQGPLILMSTIEDLLGWKSKDSGVEIVNTALGIRHADHVAPSIRKSWH
jgi:hypothetical protein